MLLEGTTLCSILSSQPESLLEFAPDGGSLLVNLHLVPALLQEVGLVIIPSVSIAESDVFQIVIRLVESIFHHIWESWMSPCNHIHEHRLT